MGYFSQLIQVAAAAEDRVLLANRSQASFCFLV
jgi:hypothetical protein